MNSLAANKKFFTGNPKNLINLYKIGNFRIFKSYLQAYKTTMDNRITTYSTLSNLVDLDTKEHKLKDIATLFLNAMNDWPTFNQTEIVDFIREIKQYFGNPLTIHKIDAVTWDISNSLDVGRHEAGSSIAELISLSTKFCNQSDFDKIVDSFLNYYNNEFKEVDF